MISSYKYIMENGFRMQHPKKNGIFGNINNFLVLY